MGEFTNYEKAIGYVREIRERVGVALSRKMGKKGITQKDLAREIASLFDIGAGTMVGVVWNFRRGLVYRSPNSEHTRMKEQLREEGIIKPVVFDSENRPYIAEMLRYVNSR
jgi:hypothetical protein